MILGNKQDLGTALYLQYKRSTWQLTLPRKPLPKSSHSDSVRISDDGVMQYVDWPFLIRRQRGEDNAARLLARLSARATGATFTDASCGGCWNRGGRVPAVAPHYWWSLFGWTLSERLVSEEHLTTS